MTYILLFFWFASAVFVIKERKIVRLIIYLAIFAAVSGGCFLLLGAPDVAMAGIITSVFTTILFIVCFERYYDLAYSPITEQKSAVLKSRIIKNYIAPFCFTVLLIALFIRFIPDTASNDYLKKLYVSRFMYDIGGENAVTAIYLGYRMYDTLLEALMLLVSIMAVIHLSWHKSISRSHGKQSGVRNSTIAVITVRLVCPILVLFSIYLIMNGHISPGGGFHGGVVAASFFVCRYMIYEIYDIRITKVITVEKLVFTGIVLLAVCFIFLNLESFFMIPKTLYLVLMNLLVGVKVACGFLIIFYRFIALERG